MTNTKWNFLNTLNEQDKQIVQQVTHAINTGDVDTVGNMFKAHTWLSAFINVPCFAFGSRAIIVAASQGNREMVDILLEHGADMNAKSEWWAGGFSVLHHPHDELSRYLIERGAQVDPHAAAALGMIDTLAEMVAEDPTVVNQRGPDGQAPLHYARDPKTIDFLLSHGADINMRDLDHESTPAQWAVSDPDKCRYLIARGAEPDIFIACLLNDAGLTKRLLELDPHALDAQVGHGSFTTSNSDGGHIYLYQIGGDARPLFLAHKVNHPEVIEVMLRYSSIASQFLLACLQADTVSVHALLAEHPNLIDTLPPRDQHLLVEAAGDNQLEAVRLMLEIGFHVDTRLRPQSQTALHRAAIHGNHEIVTLLLAHGASVHILNEFGGTPLNSCMWGSLHICNPSGNYSAVAVSLLEAGVKLPDHAIGSKEVRTILIAHGVMD